jgi:hypothetical protein
LLFLRFVPWYKWKSRRYQIKKILDYRSWTWWRNIFSFYHVRTKITTKIKLCSRSPHFMCQKN